MTYFACTRACHGMSPDKLGSRHLNPDKTLDRMSCQPVAVSHNLNKRCFKSTITVDDVIAKQDMRGVEMTSLTR